MKTTCKSHSSLHHLLLKLVLIVFNSFLINFNLAIGQSSFSKDNVIIGYTDLEKMGFITLKIPVFEDGQGTGICDYGIPPEDSGAGKITINGTTLLRFWSFPELQRGQDKSFNRYWLRAQKTTNLVDINIKNNGVKIDSWIPISKVFAQFNGANDNNYSDTIYLKPQPNSAPGKGNTCWAEIRVCLPNFLLNTNKLEVNVSFDVDGETGWCADYGKIEQSGEFSLKFPILTLSQKLSSTPQMYEITADIDPVGVYSKYEYSDNGENYKEFSTKSVKIDVAILEKGESKTVKFRYTLGKSNNCETGIIKSADIYLPAYPQPIDFKVKMDKEKDYGDAKITWKVNTVDLGDNPVDGDEFEIQRADNQYFNNPVPVATVTYNKDSANYSYLENTSELNLMGTWYYRIRRTKTANDWGWGLCSTTSAYFSMKHKSITSANATLLAGNNAKITWEYAGNVWSDNSNLIIERTNVTTQVKEIIEVPKNSWDEKFYSEELYLMCNKFTYKIYVKPGNTNYATQSPVNAASDKDIIPNETGSLLSVNASKGYFSERVALEWETDGKKIDYFTIKNRVYGSANDFKQIAQITATVGSKFYQFNDVQSTPGVIYEYEIQGVTTCSTELIKTDPKTTYGFRTPTGDIYGRVTFENGQAVENVEVRLESDNVIDGKSLVFDGNQVHSATITNKSLLENNIDSVTIQAWVKPGITNETQIFFYKSEMYELGIALGKFYFKAGTQVIHSAKNVTDYQIEANNQRLNKSDFVHVTGVLSKTSLLIYINGNFDGKVDLDVTKKIVGNENSVIIGKNFTGAIDEVRVWNRPLSEKEIKRDFNRYITGGENGLIAYWNFNYVSGNEFYDLSYKNSDYNENHGLLNGVTSDTNLIPINDQLGYKGVTGVDGSYAIRAIPYVGNGTVYNIIPKLGTHNFEPKQEVRFIGNGSQTFTVNFTDKSSFWVSGTVKYKGGTIPVEGVSFTIDGITAMGENGIVLMTDAEGEFKIMVPVGIHEVMAKKANHVFTDGGKITDINKQNRNYQDDVSGLTLTDETTVRYIGRVGGGTIQESYPLGHSLSKNNLADGIKIELDMDNSYDIDSTINTTTREFQHYIPSSKKNFAGWPKKNSVNYSKKVITIYPNNETGEFIADIIPEKFTVKVTVPGHGKIPGSGEELDLTQSFIKQQEKYSYTDSTLVDGVWLKAKYSDEVEYQKSQKFIKRYPPEVRISQVDIISNNVLPYFGNEKIEIKTLDGSTTIVPLYNANATPNKYTLGYPVFNQGEEYKLRADIFEKYIYFKSGGPTTDIDEIPTQDARVNFKNNIAISEQSDTTSEADSNGVAYYKFNAGEPDFTSALKKITATISYGNESPATTIPWTNPIDAIVLGFKQFGNNFVTKGPDNVLTVLRDPPGSNSYSYLEKGTTHSETVKYTGSLTNTGEETWTLGFKQQVVAFTGVGAGTITKVTETDAGVKIGINHEEKYEGSDSKKVTTTIKTRFQTSSDPSYVGADADVFIGYSTNLSFGTTNNVTIVSKELYGTGADYITYESITPKNEPLDWYLVQKKGLGVAQSFNTMFAYPQRHIEQVLIPEFINLRNEILIERGLRTDDDLQDIADFQESVIVVSKLPVTDVNYGKSNDNKDFGNPNFEGFDGPSYKIFFPVDYKYLKIDTISQINQSIEYWKERLSDNEKAKIDAKLLQNYSFQGGAEVEYSEAYSTVKTHENVFHIMIGGNVGNDVFFEVGGLGKKFEFKESVQTTHGGTTSFEDEASHTKGFVLSESGGDYISVDVCREKDWDESSEEYETGNLSQGNNTDIDEKDYYSSFIFKTRAGATSCPYEWKYVAKYFEPEKKHVIDEATMKIEVPKISVENDRIENVPSGGSAYFRLNMKNESEIKQDNMFKLQVVSSSNPFGAQMFVDGAPIGNGLDFIVPYGSPGLIKTLEVRKGSVMNYDKLKLILKSQCQDDIYDTVVFSVHFTPSCSDVVIEKPGNNWTYNTKLPVEKINGVDKHYMEIVLTEFDINYDSFDHINLQYKTSAESESGWITLMKYYSDPVLYQNALSSGGNVEFIDPVNAGKIIYKLKMDDKPDQKYDLRAVSVCNINNNLFENFSETVSGIKDMYCPRLFGSPQPANGILTIQDEIRLNFNEQIAEGLLNKDKIIVTGIRNGTKTDHSVSVVFDGINDFMETEFEKNMANKDIIVEMWVKSDEPQNATLFSHGNSNESITMELTSDKHLELIFNGKNIISKDTVPFEKGSWAHVAFVYSKDGYITAMYNYKEVISNTYVGLYNGIGNFVLGSNISKNSGFFKGFMHNVRVWNKVRTSGEIQVNSLAKLSGNEPGLLADYRMDEARGDFAKDNARGANMVMNGCNWSTPEGRAIRLDGTDSYVKINTGSSVVINKTMDYTIEFWFKGTPGQTNATLLSNGRGDGEDNDGSYDLFSIEFDANGKLCFKNNGYNSTVDGNFLDNNWHHFALNVGRNIGRGQIYIDGNMVNSFSTEKLGGIASAFMYLGARGWYAEGNAATLNIDNFFNGTIDEVRLWNLYKYEQQINDFNNVKPYGNEMGLLAYYPFEKDTLYTGRNELIFTLNDMKIQKDISNRVPIATGNNISVVTDTPPVKDKGPVSKLEFDFVVNNDALIISLKETPYKIEKTIITFNVDGVQDVNGNENISPFTWSAFIDRNMLKWSEPSLTVSKQVDKASVFTLQAVNKGGAVERFIIENIPSWMKVSPSGGTINPGSYVQVTFEINKGLNIGTYNEKIYLTNSDNISEVLEMKVISKGDTPNWKVDPSKFGESMSIVGVINIQGLLSNDIFDMVAAFKQGTDLIRGVANVRYVKEIDSYLVFLSVYGNEAENLEFKIWDASAGKIIDAVKLTYINSGKVTEINVFEKDIVYGTTPDPATFEGKDLFRQHIPLAKGWNWVSFNKHSKDQDDINTFLWSLEPLVKDQFKQHTDGCLIYETGKWGGPPDFKIDNKKMYQIKISNVDTLVYSGTYIEPVINQIDLETEWNRIGYLPDLIMDINDALRLYVAEDNEIIKSQFAFSMYNKRAGWVGTLEIMEPGRGYMLYVKKDRNNVKLTYPNGNVYKRAKMPFYTSPPLGWNSNFTEYEENISVIARLDVTDMTELKVNNNMVLGSFINNSCRGFSSPLNNAGVGYDPFFLTISNSNKGQLVGFRLYDGTTGNSYSIAETVPFVADAVYGTIEEPLVLTLKSLITGEGGFDNTTFIRCYPNPFNEQVNVDFAVNNGHVIIDVVNVTGSLVKSIYNGYAVSGVNTVVWDGNNQNGKNVSAGIYYIRLVSGDLVETVKLSKTR